MRKADTILSIHHERGSKGLHLERVYKHLFDPELYLRAYGKIYRNSGAMTKGTTAETVDGMNLQRIHNIIGLLRSERYKWMPVRRKEIPKANGKTRPLGIPTWSDKLVQEVLRTLMEPYYEQKFSDSSHGFRPERGCHTALRTIKRTWNGTVWFIEGDIKGCFDNIDHSILLEVIRRDIHDGRLVSLIDGLLRAGYIHDGRLVSLIDGNRIEVFLAERLKLTLSKDKTLITHAGDEKARFLGHEITVVREGDLLSGRGRRDTNGKIALLMPRAVVQKYLSRYSRGGKVVHRPELVPDTVYTTMQRYQSVLRGVYNFYCMSTNVSKRMGAIKRILETSLTKTLASKLRCKVTDIYRRYRGEVGGLRCLREVIERPGKAPLVATFGGIPFQRNPDGMVTVDFQQERAWFSPSDRRSEVVQRLIAGRCELCGAKELKEVHHIRKLADIDRPGRKPKATWEKIMSARKRKTLVVCRGCHDEIHAGRYDGPSI